MYYCDDDGENAYRYLNGSNGFESGALTDIYYQGTKADWGEIEKKGQWLPIGKTVTIHFSDNSTEIVQG